MRKMELIAPCHFGLEAVLKREIIDLGYDISHMRPVFVKLKETAWPGTGGMSEGYAVVAFEADGEVAKVWAVGCECAVEVRADEYGESWVAYRQEPGREGKV